MSLLLPTLNLPLLTAESPFIREPAILEFNFSMTCSFNFILFSKEVIKPSMILITLLSFGSKWPRLLSLNLSCKDLNLASKLSLRLSILSAMNGSNKSLPL